MHSPHPPNASKRLSAARRLQRAWFLDRVTRAHTRTRKAQAGGADARRGAGEGAEADKRRGGRVARARARGAHKSAQTLTRRRPGGGRGGVQAQTGGGHAGGRVFIICARVIPLSAASKADLLSKALSGPLSGFTPPPSTLPLGPNELRPMARASTNQRGQCQTGRRFFTFGSSGLHLTGSPAGHTLATALIRHNAQTPKPMKTYHPPTYTSTVTLDSGHAAREAFVSVGLAPTLPTTRRTLIHLN